MNEQSELKQGRNETIAFKGGERLKKDRLYYLSHPCTTYGDEAKNRKEAEKYAGRIYEQFGIRVLNPISFPLGHRGRDPMKQCARMLGACDGIILCPGWEHSVGCRREREIACKGGLEILEIDPRRSFRKAAAEERAESYAENDD